MTLVVHGTFLLQTTHPSRDIIHRVENRNVESIVFSLQRVLLRSLKKLLSQ